MVEAKNYTYLANGRYCFDVKDELGTGNFAIVYKGKRVSDQRDVAIKAINLDAKTEDIEREIICLQKIRHPNIVEFIENLGYEGNRCYLVFEFCNRQSLSTYINERGKLTPGEIQFILGQTIQGLEAIYKQNILHRDFKSQNILLHQNPGSPIQIKIADFGLSREVLSTSSPGSMTKGLGTMTYMAPEVHQNKSPTQKSDLYSLGVTILHMLTGKEINQDFYDAFLAKKSIPIGTNEHLKDLLEKLLEPNPAKRIGWAELLKHEFLLFLNKSSDITPKGQIISDSPNKWIYLFYEPTLTVHWYNAETQDYFHYKMKAIACYHAAIIIDSFLFISGGCKENNITLDKLFSIELLTRKFGKKNPMLVPKQSHYLIQGKGNSTFFSIGGQNQTGLLNNCEKYLIDNDKWVEIPPLNEKKAGATGCLFESSFLFVFGGAFGNSQYSNEIERLLLTKETEGWKLLSIPKTIWKGANFVGSVQITSTQILLFGGYSHPAFEVDSFTFDVVHGKLAETKTKLSMGARFDFSPVIYNQSVYCFDKDSVDPLFHLFDIETLSWRCKNLE